MSYKQTTEVNALFPLHEEGLSYRDFMLISNYSRYNGSISAYSSVQIGHMLYYLTCLNLTWIAIMAVRDLDDTVARDLPTFALEHNTSQV